MPRPTSPLEDTMAPANPNTLTPGQSITWTQYDPGGGSYVRTGTVLDRAPQPETRRPGVTMVWWVQPDTAHVLDAYPILAVGRASRAHPAHGELLECVQGQVTTRGELFASWCSTSPTGALTDRAGRR